MGMTSCCRRSCLCFISCFLDVHLDDHVDVDELICCVVMPNAVSLFLVIMLNH